MYGIIRMQKFKASAVTGIQIHNRREKPSRTNPDIDHARTHKNYALISCDNYQKSVKERLASVSRAVRKDAVVMCQLMVTASPEFFSSRTEEEQKAYFQQSLNFIAERYGEKNIFSAVVHLDESTPHMHVDMTPIKDGRLTAKTIFNRGELKQLQTDFAEQIGKKWGLLRGESREEKIRHLSTEEFKIQAKKEEIIKASQSLEVPQITKISPEETLPQKTGFLQKESSADVAARLNRRLETAQTLGLQVNVLKEKVSTLERKTADLEAEGMELETLRFRFVRGLTQKQQSILLDQANNFRHENALIEQYKENLRPFVFDYVFTWKDREHQKDRVNDWFKKWDEADATERLCMEKIVHDAHEEKELRELSQKRNRKHGRGL